MAELAAQLGYLADVLEISKRLAKILRRTKLLRIDVVTVAV